MLDADPIQWAGEGEWILAPQQERSRNSLRRILLAAARLFIDHGYDETTIADIAREADTAVGSIYRRFPDKRSILLAILEGYRRTRAEEIARLCDPAAWRKRDPADIVSLHVEIIYSSFVHDRGVLRLIERRRAVDPEIAQMLIGWNAHVSDAIIALLIPHAARIAHADPAAAVHHLHNSVRGALVWSILPPPEAGPQPIDPASATSKREALRMALAYLGLG
jgi:AcrR family transcriptional regulator